MTPYIIIDVRWIFDVEVDKLINRVMALSNDMRFDEIRKILESYGYTMTSPKGGSSHFIFRKDGCYPITVPKHEPIKKVYIKMIRDVIEREELNNEND